MFNNHFQLECPRCHSRNTVLVSSMSYTKNKILLQFVAWYNMLYYNTHGTVPRGSMILICRDCGDETFLI